MSGVFVAPLDGKWFPFDQQRLRIVLQADLPEDKLRLSSETKQQMPVADASRPEVDGWDISDNYNAVQSRETDPLPAPFEWSNVEPSQPQAFIVALGVKRSLFSPLLLVFSPLLLLACASLAVLYIVGSDTLKTQTELTLGCVLAVVTYLVSYATLAPRLAAPICSDYLVGITMGICVLNFIFVVAISERQSNWLLKWLNLQNYRVMAAMICCVCFIGWLVVGIFH